MTYDRLALESAAGVYRRPDVWDVDNLQFAVDRHDNLGVTVVSFAGTNELSDWWRHVLVRRRHLSGVRGLVHRGWLSDWLKVQSTVRGLVRITMHRKDALILCGHSYGGALAQFAGLDFAVSIPSEQLKLYTFGSPRVGNRGFANSLNALIFQHYRYTVATDPVPHLPFGIRYKHAGIHMRLPATLSNPHSIDTYEEMMF